MQRLALGSAPCSLAAPCKLSHPPACVRQWLGVGSQLAAAAPTRRRQQQRLAVQVAASGGACMPGAGGPFYACPLLSHTRLGGTYRTMAGGTYRQSFSTARLTFRAAPLSNSTCRLWQARREEAEQAEGVPLRQWPCIQGALVWAGGLGSCLTAHKGHAACAGPCVNWGVVPGCTWQCWLLPLVGRSLHARTHLPAAGVLPAVPQWRAAGHPGGAHALAVQRLREERVAVRSCAA